MSDIVEKALASIPGLISGGLTAVTQSQDPNRLDISQNLHDFFQGVNGLGSKYEEELFFQREIGRLKQKFAQPVKPAQMKDCLIRLIYCDMVGYDVSFGYIHAVKLAQQGTLLEKRIGYLACSLLLHENHELVVLLVNTIHKDLKSSNLLEINMALTVACQLIGSEMIPAILPLVEERLTHSKEIVRKKAVMCLHRFYQLAPNMVQHIHHKFKQALCDRDPGVMWAALYLYHDLIKDNPTKFKDITKSLASILKQVVNRKLPMEFEYHHVPAPWIQIKIIKMFALLGKNDESTSKLMYPVLTEVLKKSESNHNITFAVVYECIETITSIHPHQDMVEYAAKCTSRFLRSNNNNLRYLGIQALTAIIQISSSYAVEHQMLVIECLEDPDPSIRIKTLYLLYKMCNNVNVTVISQKFLEYYEKSTEEYIKKDIVLKVVELAEKFAPSGEWYIKTVNQLVWIAQQHVPTQLVQNTVRKISGVSDEHEDQFHVFAISTYWELLQNDNLPQQLIQIGAWVIGEYHKITPDIQPQDIFQRIEQLVLSSTTTDDSKRWLLSALTKLLIACPEHGLQSVLNIVQGLTPAQDADIQQRLRELQHLAKSSHRSKITLPLKNSNTQEFDFSLSFLDTYVSEALERGAKTYRPKSMREVRQTVKEDPSVLPSSLFTGFNFKPYDSPNTSMLSSASMYLGEGSMQSGSSGSRSGLGSDRQSEPSLKMTGVKRIWGKDGVKDEAVDDLGTKVKQTAPDTNKDKPGIVLKGEASLEEEDIGAREQRRKQELAGALFGGISLQTPAKSSFQNTHKELPANQNADVEHFPNTTTPKEEIKLKHILEKTGGEAKPWGKPNNNLRDVDLRLQTHEQSQELYDNTSKNTSGTDLINIDSVVTENVSNSTMSGQTFLWGQGYSNSNSPDSLPAFPGPIPFRSDEGIIEASGNSSLCSNSMTDELGANSQNQSRQSKSVSMYTEIKSNEHD